MLEEKFLQSYGTVFDSLGAVKACGRIATKALIEIADQLEPSVSHGSVETGMMDVAAIQALKRTL